MARRARFPVTLNAAAPIPVSVDYQTVDGTAVAGVDYEAVSGTLTFAPGETSQDILVNLLSTTNPAQSETFSVLLSNAVGAVLQDATGVATLPGAGGAPPLGAGATLLHDTFAAATATSLGSHMPEVGYSWFTVDENGTGVQLNCNAGVLQLENFGGGDEKVMATNITGLGNQPDLVLSFDLKVPSTALGTDASVVLADPSGSGVGFYYRRDPVAQIEQLQIFLWIPGVGTFMLLDEDLSNNPQYLPLLADDTTVYAVEITLSANNYAAFFNGVQTGTYTGAQGAAPMPQNPQLALELGSFNDTETTLQLSSLLVTTPTGTATTTDSLPDLFLDTFAGAAGSDIVNHTADLGGGWQLMAQNTGTSPVVLDASAPAGVYLQDRNSDTTVGTTQPFEQRAFWIYEFDFEFLRVPDANDSWDLYVYLTDSGKYSYIYADIYQWTDTRGGGGPITSLYMEGNDMGDVLGPNTSQGDNSNEIDTIAWNGVGQANTVRLEVYVDHWQVSVNGALVFSQPNAVVLLAPQLQLNFAEYADSVSAPLKVSRVRVVETPPRAPLVHWYGDITTTSAMVNVSDSLTDTAGVGLLAHQPDQGAMAWAGDPEPVPVIVAGGGFQPANGSLDLYLGQMVQSPTLRWDTTIRLEALPVNGAFNFTTEVNMSVNWSIDSTGLLTWTTSNLNAGQLTGTYQLSVGQSYQLTWISTARSMQVLIDNVVQLNYPMQGYEDDSSSNVGSFPHLMVYSADATPTITFVSYTLTEYLIEAALPKQRSLQLDWLVGAAGASVATQPGTSGGNWAVTSSGTPNSGADLVFASGGRGMTLSVAPDNRRATSSNVWVLAATVKSFAVDVDVMELPDLNGYGKSGGWVLRVQDPSNGYWIDMKLDRASDGTYTFGLAQPSNNNYSITPPPAPVLESVNQRWRFWVDLQQLQNACSLQNNGLIPDGSISMDDTFSQLQVSVQVHTDTAWKGYLITRVQVVTDPDSQFGGYASNNIAVPA